MVMVELSEELAAVLALEDEPVDRAALEMIVLELYRRGTISSGKAAKILGVERLDFIRRSGELGIPYFQITPEELREELQLLRSLTS